MIGCVHSTAEAMLGALMRFDFEVGAESEEWMHQVLQLTAHYRVTFYDAAYHALAIIHKCLFVTADERCLRRTVEAGGVTHLRTGAESAS